MSEIKKKIIRFLYVNRERGPITAYRIAEQIGHSWNTVKSHLDELVTSKHILRTSILKKMYNTRRGKYEFIKTKKYGYLINNRLVEEIIRNNTD